MADKESENDPGPDGNDELASPKDKDTKISSASMSAQNPNEIWKSSNTPSAGPRSLLLKRSDSGFGFTLRHFIVYPPETNAILAGDKRLGIGNHIAGNEPMDTIFVKNVRENSPASEAGLTTGDRIISVNGEDIAGLPYAKIIQLIHKAENYLHLLVVPKENDLLQLYFSETAHNPETNQRLRVQSPEPVGNVHTRTNCINSKPSNVLRYSKSETTPMLPSISGSSEKERVTSPPRAMDARRLSEGNNEKRSKPLMTVCSRRMRDIYAPQAISDTSSCGSSESGPNYSYGGAPPACRFSLDAGVGPNSYFDSLSDASVKNSYGSEDSLIMSRLRKSFEQKEEFLNRPPQTVNSASNTLTAKEFYSRPQKLTGQAWPPSTPSGTGSAKVAESNVSGVAVKGQNKPNFVSSLDKIQETPSSSAPKSLTETVEQPFQVVSVRTKQFENGAVEDKTELYRSELARLSTKHNVTSVAARKRDFENRAQIVRQSFAARESRSLESATVPLSFYSTPGSGNRLIPIGSKNLHCEPPADFSSLTTLSDDTKMDELSLQKNKPVMRQDSYLAACSKPTITITRKTDSNEDLSATDELNKISSEKNNVHEDDKSTRRISYIKATGGDTMNVDSEYEFSDNDTVAVLAPQRSILGFRKATESTPDQDQHCVVKEGSLFCKVTQVEGKRAGDRSWKQLWLILKGPFLYLCKEKRESLSVLNDTPATFDRPDLGASCDRIDIRRSIVEVACDYTKRKHVFRLNAPSVGAELLLQAEDVSSMTQWVKVLREQALVSSSTDDILFNSNNSNTSPSTINKSFRKFPSLRNRSPTGPTGDTLHIKTKKSFCAETQQTSPKTRTWKNKMARQFRRIQPGSSSPNAAPAVLYPPGATIGIPLELCPSSSFSEYVPLLVEMCTNIVEAKGLEIIGIYRVPGNSAAVSSLTEAVNRGLDVTILDQDPRWSDVNVISSLLKSFFRKLPDALLTSELYPHFIKADRIEDAISRMENLRKLVHELPDHNFETLRYLLFHLKKVVANSSVNKMEARNLAIVFGPTLVRNGDDMVTMVTDMSHQCRIVESLLCHVDWCYGDGNLAELRANIPAVNSVPELDATSSNHGVLLENIRKVEASIQSSVSAKDIVSTIIGAANRKKQKTSKILSSTRKTNSLSATISQIGSSSEDMLDSGPSYQNILKGKNDEKNDGQRENENKSDVDKKKELESHISDTSNSVPNEAETGAVNARTASNYPGSNNWTYANLAATTQERIRRFEQETKAMLQRELTRQKRASELCYDDLSKEKLPNKHKDNMCAENQHGRSTSSLLSDKYSESGESEVATGALKDQSICDSPPPVIVMRRNLPNVNGRNVTMKNDNNFDSDSNNNSNNSNDNDSKSLKRLKTSEEFLETNSLMRSNSLDSLNQVGRPSSHGSDDGGDLLLSLTSTFDRKLKSLNRNIELTKEVEASKLVTKTMNNVNELKTDDNSTFKDPSLHRMSERNAKVIENQNKENNQNDEKMDSEDVKVMRSCITCGCSVKHSDAIQQNCDNWRRTVLQETHLENRRQENVIRREPKLFYSNSVKLRRSESLKEDQGTGVKLRRSGSLNKHEPKISKLESWILTRNADAIKLKRSESLSKNEKTESNLLKRRQMELNKKTRSEKDNNCGGKTKRRTGTKNSSIKRRHTVGGTKDFDKVSWLQSQQRENNKENRKERRTSSPDLSSTRMADLLIEVVVRPRSIITIDRNLISKLLNVPLESQV